MSYRRITFSLALVLALPWAARAESSADAAERLSEIGARIAKDSQGGIEAIDLDSVWLADSDVSLVSAFPRLGRLSLSHTRITDLGVQHLKSLKSLEELDVSFVQRFTDAGIASLLDMHKLRRLALRGTPVTSRILPAVAMLTELEDLDLSYTHVSDENFDELLALSKLRRLSIGGTRVTGAVLPLLRLLPELEELDLGGVQRVDSGLWGFALSEANTVELAKLDKLRSLDLGGATLRDTALDRAKRTSVDRREMVQIAKLGALTNLRKLDLSGLSASSFDLRFLKELEDLRELNLSIAQGVDDEIAPTLEALPLLEVLHLSGSNVGDPTLEALGKFENLKRLSVGGTKVTAGSVERFRELRPDCTVAWFPKRQEPVGPDDTEH